MGFLDGKAALITGGTRGIGRAIAESLLSEGCNVVINGRSAEKAQSTIDEINVGDRLTFLGGDVTDKATCYGLVDGTIEKYGRIDIVVNNAGGSVGSSVLWEMDDADWDYTLNWNLNHAVWTTKRAIPDMLKRSWGRIINISSIYGKMSLPTVSHYVTTKHAMIGLTKAVAAETGPLGITCNAICPGFIKTDVFMTEGPVTAAAMGMEFDDWVAMVTQISMTKTTNEAEEVGAMALLLCSPQGKGITGAALNVDGGACPY
jgi:NAD(P)-dependent dehydrogenase (short-subunit alcohol dehydrogenase family)